MKRNIFLLVFVFSFFSIGCSAHSPMIIKNTYNMETSFKYSAHKNKVYLTNEKLSTKDYKYEVISPVDAGKVWYGKSGDIYESMAVMARELGADAVIEIKVWFQPSGFSWSAPHGSGKAIKFIDKVPTDFSGIQGEWR